MKSQIAPIAIALLCIPAVCLANAAAISGEPNPPGLRLHVAKDNGLKVQKEVIDFVIHKQSPEAQVTVKYQVLNTSTTSFEGDLFFIVPDHGSGNFQVSCTSPNKAAQKIDYEQVKEIQLNEDIHERLRKFSGYKFSVSIAPLEPTTITFTYVQKPGWELDRKNPTFAATSHYLNLAPKRHPYTHMYEYYLFPITTFSQGVDDIIIRFTWPKQFANGAKATGFNSNIGSSKEEMDNYSCSSEKETCTFERHFTDIPVDIAQFTLKTGNYNKMGVTLYPAYKYQASTGRRSFSVSGAFDYFFRNMQVSLAAQYGTVDTFQLIQEIKFFPPGVPVYFLKILDYRISLGLVEQFTPYTNFGFKFSGGIRILVAFEFTYQMFPPWVTDHWTHEFLFGIPVSF